MTQKDLAEEYLDRKIKQEPFKSLTKGFEYAFSADDLKAAFTAGRESVVESLPKLKWIDGLSITDDFEEVFCEECITTTPFGEYSIRYFYYNKTYVLFFTDEKVSNDFKLLNDIKLFAEKDYQNRIKHALGL